MSRRRIVALRQILAVRSAQEASCRMHLGLTAREGGALQDSKILAEDRLDLGRAGWSSAAGADPLDLMMARAWSVTVLEHTDALSRLDRDIQENAHAALDQRGRLQAAQARTRLAQRLFHREVRWGRRLAEEGALSALEDRFAHRGGTR